MRRCGSLVTLVLLGATTADLAGDEKAKGKSDPAGVPVEATLVAKQATYTLDLGGKTGEEFRKAVKDAAKTGAPVPQGPKVDLVLELKNTSDKEVRIWVKGDPVVVTLDLRGPGAISASSGLAFTADFRLPEALALAPGKSHTFPITVLHHGSRGQSERSFWTEPGEYTLTARCKTAVSPAPAGSKAADGGFGNVTLTSAPLTLKVEAKK